MKDKFRLNLPTNYLQGNIFFIEVGTLKPKMEEKYAQILFVAVEPFNFMERTARALATPNGF